jgi:hypothetical protein
MRPAALAVAGFAGIVLGAVLAVAVHPLVGIGLGIGLFAAIAAGAGITAGRRP